MPPSEGTQLVPRTGMLYNSPAGSAWSPWLAPCPRDDRVVGCGSCGKIPWGSHRAGRVWILLKTPPRPPLPVLDFFPRTATVSAAVVPSTPIFSPTMGGGGNSSLSLDSTGAEPMPGGYLTLTSHPHLSSLHCSCYPWVTLSSSPAGEKRKLPENLTLEDAKRLRVMGDIPMELVNEVMLTITDPAAMLGPEVGSPACWPIGEGPLTLLRPLLTTPFPPRQAYFQPTQPETKQLAWRSGEALSNSMSLATR